MTDAGGTAENQKLMAEEGGVAMLITLMTSKNEQIQRQACKALANLGVNGACALE